MYREGREEIRVMRLQLAREEAWRKSRVERFMDVVQVDVKLVGVRKENTEDRVRRRQMIGCVATPEANSGSLPPSINDQKTNYTSPFSSHLAASCKREHQLEAKPDAFMSLLLNWKGSKGQKCNFTSLFVSMLYYHYNKVALTCVCR